jgi:hypothetical protein
MAEEKGTMTVLGKSQNFSLTGKLQDMKPDLSGLKISPQGEIVKIPPATVPVEKTDKK